VDTVTLSIRSDDKPIRLLQISDTHLFAGAKGQLLGIRTADSFQAVLHAIQMQNQHFELVLATGDLSQDYTPASYQRFASMAHALAKPIFWLPGNHDDGPLMRQLMPDCGVSNARQILLPGWQIIMLDTQVYSVVHGWLKVEQMQFLEQCLASEPDRFTLICMHHNTFPVGSAWLDQHDLKNAPDLLALLARFPKVKAVLCGHVHQETDIEHKGVRFISSPSTCIQFEPLSRDFGLDTKGPGWRYLQLHADGRVDTQVHRLPAGCFIPDGAAGGY
jgi:Icc protein